MKVFTQGGTDVTLTQSNFVAEGGEGRVHAVGATGYKIYHDPARAIAPAKIQELGAIQDPDVIRPLAPIFTASRGQTTHVGHTFRFIPQTYVLCQLFPRAFRDREGLTADKVCHVVGRLRSSMEAIHRAGVLVVDANEMNVLVARDFSATYWIDVDSYQTPHFAATAIMASVRDPQVHGNVFTELSDWFSFAIITFQLFVGIHPFKGKHPTVHGFEDRMKRGISVFDQAVKLPSVCYPLSSIPPAYHAWYRALFADGKRAAPPTDMQASPAVQASVPRPTMTATAALEILELLRFPSDIRATWGRRGQDVAVHSGNAIYLGSRQLWRGAGARVAVGTFVKPDRTVAAWIEGCRLRLHDLTADKAIDCTIAALDVSAAFGAIYIRTSSSILTLQLSEVGGSILAGFETVTHVLEHACSLHEGCAVQSLLGDPHASLFLPDGGCMQVALPELKGYTIIQAKHDAASGSAFSRHGSVLMVLANEGGHYDRFVYRFLSAHGTRTLEVIRDVALSDLNFCVLDTGVCVCITEADELELSTASAKKIVRDPVLTGEMRLVKDGMNVRFFRDKTLYSMRMK